MTSIPLSDMEFKTQIKHVFAQDKKPESLEALATLEPLQPTETVDENHILLVCNSDQSHLVAVDKDQSAPDAIRLFDLSLGKPLKPIPIAKWSSALAQKKVLRIVPKKVAPPELSTTVATNQTPNANDKTVAKEPENAPLVSDTAERDKILDTGAFSQLVEAAQRSGIVPGISIIIQVRDCEFRLGRYNKALQIMESQFSSFCGSAQQRVQRIKREEADIASGRVKISPKEAQAKRVKDNRDHENIERARTRFSRVLEGLRTLIHLAPGEDPTEENSNA